VIQKKDLDGVEFWEKAGASFRIFRYKPKLNFAMWSGARRLA
jgi:hypothetical protein